MNISDRTITGTKTVKEELNRRDGCAQTPAGGDLRIATRRKAIQELEVTNWGPRMRMARCSTKDAVVLGTEIRRNSEKMLQIAKETK